MGPSSFQYGRDEHTLVREAKTHSPLN